MKPVEELQEQLEGAVAAAAACYKAPGKPELGRHSHDHCIPLDERVRELQVQLAAALAGGAAAGAAAPLLGAGLAAHIAAGLAAAAAVSTSSPAFDPATGNCAQFAASMYQGAAGLAVGGWSPQDGLGSFETKIRGYFGAPITVNRGESFPEGALVLFGGANHVAVATGRGTEVVQFGIPAHQQGNAQLNRLPGGKTLPAVPTLSKVDAHNDGRPYTVYPPTGDWLNAPALRAAARAY